MPRRVSRRTLVAARLGDTGRVSVLTPDVEQRILDAIRDGNHITTACALARVPTQTLYRWLDAATEAERQEANGTELDDAAMRYLRFRDRLTLARAEAEEMAVGVVRKVMVGGYLLEEEPALNGDGLPVYDEEGNLAYKRKWAQPDGRLALEYLARTSPDRFGRQPSVTFEVPAEPGESAGGTGPADAAVAALAERLQQAVAMSEQRALGAGDVGAGVDEDPVDAEIVEG